MKISVGDFSRYRLGDSRLEQSIRLVLSGAFLTLGTAALIAAFEWAFQHSADGFYRPEEDDYIFVVVAGLSFVACFLGLRLRFLSWVMTAIVGYWAITVTDGYVSDYYYAMGQDGCLRCTGAIADIHLRTAAFGIACFGWALVTRRKWSYRRTAGLLLALPWLLLLLIISAMYS